MTIGTRSAGKHKDAPAPSKRKKSEAAISSGEEVEAAPKKRPKAARGKRSARKKAADAAEVIVLNGGSSGDDEGAGDVPEEASGDEEEVVAEEGDDDDIEKDQSELGDDNGVSTNGPIQWHADQPSPTIQDETELDIPEKITQKVDQTADLLMIFSGKTDVRFRPKKGEVKVVRGRWCLICKLVLTCSGASEHVNNLVYC